MLVFGGVGFFLSFWGFGGRVDLEGNQHQEKRVTGLGITSSKSLAVFFPHLLICFFCNIKLDVINIIEIHISMEGSLS